MVSHTTNTIDKLVCIYAAVGIVINDKDQFLISKRPSHKFKGGYWEFPGGKIEPEEESEAALIRELKEEVGITVLKCEQFMELHHHENNRETKLVIFIVRNFEGVAVPLENQEIRWIKKEEFSEYVFLEANSAIIKKCLDEGISSKRLDSSV